MGKISGYEERKPKRNEEKSSRYGKNKEMNQPPRAIVLTNTAN